VESYLPAVWRASIGSKSPSLCNRRAVDVTNSRVLIFVHIPKTAGTTFRRVLERQYSADEVLPLYESELGKELASIPPAQMNRLRVVLGHFYFGAHAFIPRPSTYVTFLRDPVDRVLSHYYFVRQSPEHEFHEFARQLNLSEFLAYCSRSTHGRSDDDQTRQLAGECGKPSSQVEPAEMLLAAKRHLSEYFAAVGITEEFDRSLILMKRILGWKRTLYTRQNVTRGRPARHALPENDLSAIYRYNKLDLELYSYAAELFREQVSAQGGALARELQWFTKLNAAYETLGRLNARISRPRRSSYRD
jgi:Sulfotransferase family